jgi:predicted TIM-barrel fold metal-dependent hydrolase
MRKLLSFALAWFAALSPSVAQESERAVFRSAYRIVDTHAHGAVPTREAFRAQLDVMDATGVDAVVILLFDPAGWTYRGGWSESILKAWLELRKEFPGRLAVFGSVDFGRVAREPDFFKVVVSELEAQAALGMQGVKIWKNLGMHHRDADGSLLKIDDPRLDPFWAKCGELKLPVFIHSADPREYWYPNTYGTFQYKIGDVAKYHGHPVVPPWEELIAQRDRVVRKHRGTTFIGAHFASLTTDFDRLAALLDECPNLSVECGARLRFLYRYHPKAVRDFFVKYQDRILFGTDGFLPDGGPAAGEEAARKAWRDRRARFYSDYLEYFETDRFVKVPGGFESEWLRLKGIALPAEVLEKLYHGNAERLVRGLGAPGPARVPKDP